MNSHRHGQISVTPTTHSPTAVPPGQGKWLIWIVPFAELERGEVHSGGALVVLQPTLTSQLLALLTQFSLPSPIGLSLHLSLMNPTPSSSIGSTATAGGTEDSSRKAKEIPDSPRVTEDLWPILFSPYLINPPLSAISTSQCYTHSLQHHSHLPFTSHSSWPQPHSHPFPPSLPIIARLALYAHPTRARWLPLWLKQARSGELPDPWEMEIRMSVRSFRDLSVGPVRASGMSDNGMKKGETKKAVMGGEGPGNVKHQDSEAFARGRKRLTLGKGFVAGGGIEIGISGEAMTMKKQEGVVAGNRSGTDGFRNAMMGASDIDGSDTVGKKDNPDSLTKNQEYTENVGSPDPKTTPGGDKILHEFPLEKTSSVSKSDAPPDIVASDSTGTEALIRSVLPTPKESIPMVPVTPRTTKGSLTADEALHRSRASSHSSIRSTKSGIEEACNVARYMEWASTPKRANSLISVQPRKALSLNELKESVEKKAVEDREATNGDGCGPGASRAHYAPERVLEEPPPTLNVEIGSLSLNLTLLAPKNFVEKGDTTSPVTPNSGASASPATYSPIGVITTAERGEYTSRKGTRPDYFNSQGRQGGATRILVTPETPPLLPDSATTRKSSSPTATTTTLAAGDGMLQSPESTKASDSDATVSSLLPAKNEGVIAGLGLSPWETKEGDSAPPISDSGQLASGMQGKSRIPVGGGSKRWTLTRDKSLDHRAQGTAVSDGNIGENDTTIKSGAAKEASTPMQSSRRSESVSSLAAAKIISQQATVMRSASLTKRRGPNASASTLEHLPETDQPTTNPERRSSRIPVPAIPIAGEIAKAPNTPRLTTDTPSNDSDQTIVTSSGGIGGGRSLGRSSSTQSRHREKLRVDEPSVISPQHFTNPPVRPFKKAMSKVGNFSGGVDLRMPLNNPPTFNMVAKKSSTSSRRADRRTSAIQDGESHRLSFSFPKIVIGKAFGRS